MEFLVNFLHFAGIIIGLGAVTVIDTMGFISRNSKEWTKTTIKAHHVTKPLIWLGILLVILTWFFLFNNTTLHIIKSILILMLILNGLFLSFYVSPKLDKTKTKLLPKEFQIKITISMIISFLSWWSLVVITFL